MAHPDGLPTVEVTTNLSGKLGRVVEELELGDKLALVLEVEVTGTGRAKLRSGARHNQSLSILDGYVLKRDDGVDVLERYRNAHREEEERRRGVERLPFDRGAEVHTDDDHVVMTDDEVAETQERPVEDVDLPDPDRFCPECDGTLEQVPTELDALVFDRCGTCGWESDSYGADLAAAGEPDEDVDPEAYKPENAPDEIRELLDGKVDEVKARIEELSNVAVIYAAARFESFWKDRKSVAEALQARLDELTGPEPPFEGYDDLTVDEVKQWLTEVEDGEIVQRCEAYEKGKKNRKGILDHASRRIGELWAEEAPAPDLPRAPEEPDEDEEGTDDAEG